MTVSTMRRTAVPPHLEQLEPRLLLSHSVLEVPVERAVFDGVVVDFAQYPLEPDHPAHSWSEWGKGLAASNGKIYTAIGDHNAPTTNGLNRPGNAYVYEYDPETMILRCVADLNSGNPDFDPLTSWGNGKLHGRISEGNDGNLYFGGYWGYDPVGLPGSITGNPDPVYYEGDYIFRFDPVTEEIGVVNYVPGEPTIPMRSTPSSGLYAPEMIFYAETTNGDGTTDRDLLVYDLNAAPEDAIIFLGDHDLRYDRAMFVDANGDAWFNDGGGTLRQFDLSERALGISYGGMPGETLRQTASGPDANGYLYGATHDTNVLFRFDPATGEFKTIMSLEANTASMELDPSGQYLYYYPGSTGHYDDCPLYQVDITDIDNPVKRKVVELADYIPDAFGYHPGGSYSMMINADGSVVYIEMNVNWDYPPDHPAFAAVHIPSAVPEAPTDLAATTLSSARIELSWVDNTEYGCGFKLERSSDGVSDWAQIATLGTTSYTDIDLTPSTTYYYRVVGFNLVGDSDYSNTAVATTTEPVVPDAPTGLSIVTESPTQLDLAWTDNSDNETGFKIERMAEGAGAWTLVTTADKNSTSYSDTGLDSGVRYYYRVTATNALGDSEASNAVSAATFNVLATLSETWTGKNKTPWPEMWTIEGNVADVNYWWIQSNKGRVQGMAGSSGAVQIYVNNHNLESLDATVMFSISSNGMGFGMMARRADDNPDTYYFTQLIRGNKPEHTLRISKMEDGEITVLADTGVVYAKGNYMMRFLCVTNDQGTTDLRVKIWPSGSDEPDSWDGQVTDDTPSLQGVSGRFGLLYLLYISRRTDTDDLFAMELELPPDTTAPTVTVNPLLTADRTPELTGTIDDPTATVEVQVIMGGQTYLALNDGITWVLPDNTIDPLANGVYDVMVTATDPADNVGYDLTTYELTIAAATLTGYAWEDFNDDAEIDFGEHAIADVTVTLSGTDEDGNPVSATTTTDEDGIYAFDELRPGTYTMTETQPADYVDGQDALGTLGGDDSVNDAFTVSVDWGEVGMNYNYGERPQAGATVSSGQTATMGFWQNKNGQELVRSLNPDDPTQLGDWLAATFPNMYGVAAGDNDLTGLDADAVADFYINLFKKIGTPKAGPAKVDAQAMAVAFAIYVTNQTLAGDTATAYGFDVTTHGVGVATWNVGSSGAAFGVEDDTEMTVLDIMLAADAQAVDGCLYNLDSLLRSLANEVFTAINEGGEI